MLRSIVNERRRRAGKNRHIDVERKKASDFLWPQWIKALIKNVRQNSSLCIPSMCYCCCCCFAVVCICDFFLTYLVEPSKKTETKQRDIYFCHAGAQNTKWKQSNKNPFEHWIFRCVYEYFWLMINLCFIRLPVHLLARLICVCANFFFYFWFPLKFRKQELLVFSFCTRLASRQMAFDRRTW